MRKFLLMAFMMWAFGVSATYLTPYGYTLPEGFQQKIPLMELPTLDHAALLAEDTEIEMNGGRTNNGRIISMYLDANAYGLWSALPDGGRVWQLRFRTQGAMGVSVFFNDFALPQGAQLFIYNVERNMYEGPWNSSENNEHGIFATLEVVGDEAILEYIEPYGVVETPHLGIRGFGHYYRYVYNYQNEDELRGGSEACEVDINCPEGVTWQAEKRSVVRLNLVEGQFIGLCSGSLVNNFRKDCTNYILTALHCALNSSASDLLSSQARFNFEKSGCGSGSTTSTHNKTGLIRRADSADGGGQSGSDFLLLELEDPINQSWNPFYAGFDATGAGSSAGVSIHHPAGDVKKISTYTTNLTSVWYGSPGSHWQVIWAPTVTNWGVTEGGSSGSPIFNTDHKIVGTLTGGTSFCNIPAGPDYYGKVSKHWSGNQQPVDQKLKAWLDPDNTGLQILYGAFRNTSLPEGQQCSEAYVELEPELEFGDVEVYPTLGSDLITIECMQFQMVSRVTLTSATGELVMDFKLTAARTQKDLSRLAPGIYFLTFRQDNGHFVTKKLTRI